MKKVSKKISVAIVYRLQTEHAVLAAKNLAVWLSEKKVKAYTAPDQKIIPGTLKIKSAKDFKKMAFVVVLGGDGTYLRAVRLLAGQPIPIVGFNMGSLGFLTSFPVDQIYDVVQLALDQKIPFYSRSMIQVTVKRRKIAEGKIGSKKITKHEYFALNDVVLERGSYSQLINCAISIENHLISKVKADGFVIATPTGSTAYNLSAGGPLLHPEAQALVFTSVAPHSLSSRPLIFPDDRTLCLKIQGENSRAHLIIDGRKEIEVDSNDEILVNKSPFKHYMAKSSVHQFFHLLREKLKFGERG